MVENLSAITLQTIYQNFQDLRSSSYIQISCLVVLLYDIILTFADEVNLVWPGGWTLGKFLFFINRYPLLIELIIASYYPLSNPPSTFCFMQDWVDGLSTFIFVIPVQAVLIIRTYALWDRSWKILFLTCGAALATQGVNLWYVIIFFRAHRTLVPIPTFGCVLQRKFTKAGIYILFSMFTAFDTLILGLTVFVIIRHHYRFGQRVSPLLHVLMRDGLVYYLALCAASFSNIVLLYSLPTERDTFFLATPRIVRVASAILCSRIILNVRDILSPHALVNLSIPTLNDSRVDPEVQYTGERKRPGTYMQDGEAYGMTNLMRPRPQSHPPPPFIRIEHIDPKSHLAEEGR